MENHNKKSKNQYLLQDEVSGKFKMLENEHFSKWALLKGAKKLNVKKPDGRSIQYEGSIDFSGSVKDVYWAPDYIPEYIKEFIANCINAAIYNSQKHGTHPNQALDELKDIFKPQIKKSLDRMADIDSRLTGNGHKKGGVKNTSSIISDLENYLDERTKAFKLSKIDSLIWYVEWLGNRLIKIKNLVIVSGVGVAFSYLKDFWGLIKQVFSNL